MENRDLKDFGKILAGTCDYYEKQVTENLTNLYFNGLKEFPIEKVKEAFNSHIRTSKFFPKVSELIELIEGNKEEKALIAWITFRDTIRHHGGDRSVLFEDPKITWLIESYGGWIKVCEMETKDLDFMRLGFIRSYISVREGLPFKKLIGRFEWENGARGYLGCPVNPIVIGNNQEIKQLEF